MRIRWLVFLLAFAVSATSAAAQVAGESQGSAETGLSIVDVFKSEFASDTQHRSIVEGPDGLIYTGTPRGVLVYDGVRWSRMRSVPSHAINALDISEDGRIWIGSQGELGVFAPDSVGAMIYASLTEHLPAGASATDALGSVRGVTVFGDAVYFAADGRVLRWRDGDGFRTWAVAGLPRLSRVDDALYVHDLERGLLRLDGEGLRAVPGGDVFAGADQVAQVLSGPPREVVVTGTGLWSRSGSGFIPLATAADEYLRESGILTWVSRSLPDGRLALATQRGGLVLLRPDGTVDAVLDESAGLPGSTVYSVFADRYGGVWVGTVQGIARIMPGPLSIFDRRVGLEGVVLDIARDRGGRLLVATSTGLYRLIPRASPVRPVRFEKLGGPEGACLDLLNTSEGLLAACSGGVFRAGEEGARLAEVEGAYALGQGGDGRIWVGTRSGGLFMLTPGTGPWAAVPVADGIKGGILTVYVGMDNTVWLGTGAGRAVRVRPGRQAGEAPEVTHYGEADGLVGTNWVKVWGLGGRPAFGTKAGLYRFHEGSAPAFALDEGVGKDLVASAWTFPNVFLLAAGPDGDLWYLGGDDLAVARNRRAGWEIDRAPLQHLFGLGAYYALTVESDGTAWLGGTHGLVRRAPARGDSLASYSALVRRVSTVGADSVLAASHWLPALGTPLGAANNALRFEYAAPSFTWRLRFRYRLLPLEAEWSSWTEATAKEYTNLPPGRYTFEVQAEDGRMVHSSVGTFGFEIAPPWYDTAWARSLWALLALGAVAALVSGSARWRTRRLREQARVLEETVAARTTEVERQKAQLSAQADQLAAQADQLRALDEAKSRFFANVSHEFRTPLTLTLGPLDDIKSGIYGPLDGPMAAQVDLARRSAGRVLDLINQILDVARLESGKTPLHARPLDLGAFVEAVAQPFREMAARQTITLEVALPAAPVEVYADPVQLEKAVANLLSNALKFTPEGGTVRVTVTSEDGAARVAVRDSGPGIPSADLPHVFDRFYRVNEATQAQLGTGIGLALAKEVVDLHGGALSVESQAGFGSTFTLTLPLGRAHLAPDQIDEAAGPWAPGEPPASPLLAEPGGDGSTPLATGSQAESAYRDTDDVTTLLVVEDHPEVRAYIRRHLEQAYRVLEAADGEEGLAIARARLPDLILSDVMMPKLDGLGLCRALRAEPETDFIPVILLTAKAAPEDRLEGLAEHCDDYLTKPFDVAELRARIDNLIAIRKRLRERFRQTESDGDRLVASPLRLAPPAEITSADDAFLKSVAEAVDAHLGDETFSVERLAEEAGVSRSHLHRQLKELAGQAPSDLIRTVRLERAAHLLAAGAGNVSEIAYAVGFKSVGHFSDSFVHAYGCRPSSYVTREGTVGNETL
jgi:signal transduction histidine kinase/DNA-binding response OmpR family regulator/ligand-binding sensor domain-containing protein